MQGAKIYVLPGVAALVLVALCVFRPSDEAPTQAPPTGPPTLAPARTEAQTEPVPKPEPGPDPSTCRETDDPARASECWVRFLAGSELKGRENGSPGGERAREAIARSFEAWGLEPVGESFVHPIEAGANVIARLPGSDPARRDEVVVFGAHYDHLGEVGGEVFYGADDNASGVAILLEVARALSSAPEAPPRSILFVAFDAEEPPEYLTPKMGSQAFVDEPPLPLDQIVAMVCLDLMGGNAWPGYDSPLYVMGTETFAAPPTSVLASTDELDLLPMHLRLVEDLPSGRQAFSDYGPFWDAKIPVVFFSAGRSPHYHQPTDVPATIDFPKIAAEIPVVTAMVRHLAEVPDRPSWTEVQPVTLRDARAVVRQLEIATGQTEVPVSSEVEGLGQAKLTAMLEDLRTRLKRADDPLTEEDARAFIAGSLALQCVLAPDDHMPPAACFLL